MAILGILANITTIIQLILSIMKPINVYKLVFYLKMKANILPETKVLLEEVAQLYKI